MPLDSGIQTNQILRNDDEVCIPLLSSTPLTVKQDGIKYFIYHLFHVVAVEDDLSILIFNSNHKVSIA